ncbi:MULTISPECIES: AbrB family transcriptional regulator [Thermococcus]|uniref:Transcription regulator, putative n=1 Tax=Thermococcus nautili TaxID=195522 RepID=W8NTG2_9EURY|nr:MULTISPECIES: AbrB family transcriptional regulator [Thermococcus]AHL22412.1 transcription regulator, putative [Thermococcus nautili]NJE48336.1 AbrB family transcriptional regulator [Thermococcus sp. 9N3]CAI1493542.1 putative Transcription regulator [Thermococcus nautili]
MEIVVKRLDSQGRLLIPREIREKLGDEVIIVDLGDRVELLPRRRANLRKFFDSVEIDELKEWEELKKELWME